MTLSSAEPTPSGDGRLRVLDALGEGWGAFCRAPWTFVGFTVLVGILNAFCNLLQRPLQVEPGQMPPPLLILVGLAGAVLSVIVSLWATTGMLRGAWTALSGECPTFSSFTRWDGRAMVRLLWASLALAVVFAVILGIAVALGLGVFARFSQALQALPIVAALVVLVYLAVNQTFLSQIALLQGPGPWATVARGREVVDPQWGRVLLLILLDALLLFVGVLLCFVGLLAAAPLVACVSTAAYRQLFGSEDPAGLLSR
jgi:uncharacterized membrane protein